MDIELDGGMDLDGAARLLGVHYQTAYRWVRSGVLPAVKVGSEYRLIPADVEALAERRRRHQPLAYTGRQRDWDRLRDQLYEALVAGDETGARRVFERIRLARVPLLDQCEQLVAPVMVRLGEEWGAGTLSGATVRLGSGIVERSLVWALNRLPHWTRSPVLVIRPKGEPHRLPPVMAMAVLREAGWEVNLVADLPATEVVNLARRARPALAVVSPTLTATGEVAATLQARLQREASIPVLLGGCEQLLGGLVEDARTVAALAGLTFRPARPDDDGAESGC